MSDTPKAVQQRLTIAGGVNPHGEPNFRVIHGTKAIDIVDGVEMPRYLPRNNWHLTAWIPPDKNPPFGGYEHCYALGTQLDEGMLAKIVELISVSRKYTLNERYQAIMAREQKIEKDFEAEAFDILDDGVKAFHAHPFVTVPGTEKENKNASIILTDAD